MEPPEHRAKGPCLLRIFNGCSFFEEMRERNEHTLENIPEVNLFQQR